VHWQQGWEVTPWGVAGFKICQITSALALRGYFAGHDKGWTGLQAKIIGQVTAPSSEAVPGHNEAGGRERSQTRGQRVL